MNGQTDPGGSVVERTAAVVDGADPRVTSEYVRVLPASDVREAVVLVGVVHDHPASSARAEQVVSSVAPDAVAVELPNALVPLFRQYAAAGESRGGEMTAAIAAADTDHVVGVDAPSGRSLTELCLQVVRERPSLSTVRRTAAAVGRLVAQTVRGRLHALGVTETSGISDSHTYACGRSDSPEEQAADEADHLRRSEALLRSFEPPDATRLLDDARERAMAAELRSLRQRASVVGVVGSSHLDAVADALDD